jgi:hypothetical protein
MLRLFIQRVTPKGKDKPIYIIRHTEYLGNFLHVCGSVAEVERWTATLLHSKPTRLTYWELQGGEPLELARDLAVA